MWDVDGNEYLDLIAGIATSTLGHGNTAIADAVSDQVKRLAHTSNLFAHEPGLNLAEKLIDLTGADARVFFSQDGPRRTRLPTNSLVGTGGNRALTVRGSR